MAVVGLAENKASQPSLAGAWAELGNIGPNNFIDSEVQAWINYLL